MKLTYLSDGRIIPTFEVGDLVRLIRDEPGPIATAVKGDWGQILRFNKRGRVDIQLAGYCRPRSAAMGTVCDIQPSDVIPCDTKGLPLELQKWKNWLEVEEVRGPKAQRASAQFTMRQLASRGR